MENAKIEIKVGIVKFVGEGEQEWLSKQLNKVLEKIPDLANIQTGKRVKENSNSENSNYQESEEIHENESLVPTNLVTFLREKNATTNQVNKFLVTSVYLQLNGQNRMTTTDISDSLKSSNQSKLANKSDALNKNVGKGFCEKEGSQFFVTQEGLNYVEEMQ